MRPLQGFSRVSESALADSDTCASTARGAAALPVARLRADLLEDRLEQRERREHVLARERTRTRGATGGERLLDRTVLLRVLEVQPVERMVARRPDRGPREGPPRTLRHLLDERQVGDAVDDVVERVVATHPVAHDRAPFVARLSRAQLLRDPREALLAAVQPVAPLGRDLRRCDPRREPLELGAPP